MESKYRQVFIKKIQVNNYKNVGVIQFLSQIKVLSEPKINKHELCSRPAKEEKQSKQERVIEWEFTWEWMWKSKRDWMNKNVNETAIEWVNDKVGMTECEGKSVVKEQKRLNEWQCE